MKTPYPVQFYPASFWPATWRRALIVPLVCLGLTGCSTTGGGTAGTGNAGPAVVGSGGEIHKGSTMEQVRLALGNPDHTATRKTSRGVQVAWTYTETHHGHGGGYFGLARGWSHGEDTNVHDPNNFYAAPHTSQTLGTTPGTDVPIERVIFENGVAISYEAWHQHGHKRR